MWRGHVLAESYFVSLPLHLRHKFSMLRDSATTGKDTNIAIRIHFASDMFMFMRLAAVMLP
jgi:hypothetical protein